MPGAYEHIPALRSDLDRLVAMLDAADDLSAPVPGLDWTAAQAATHLVVALGAMEGTLRRDLSALLGVIDESTAGGTKSAVEAVASVNAKALSMVLITDPKQAAQSLRDVGTALVAAAEAPQPEEDCPTPWYGLTSTRTAHAMASVAHGEILVHGLDISRALGRPWPIPAASAAPIVHGVMTGMLPYMLTDEGRAFSGTFGIKLRGGEDFSLTLADGTVTVGPPRPGPDCWISMDPPAALLVVYGRGPEWRQIATGRITAYGRRPWLAFRFSRFFDKP